MLSRRNGHICPIVGTCGAETGLTTVGVALLENPQVLKTARAPWSSPDFDSPPDFFAVNFFFFPHPRELASSILGTTCFTPPFFQFRLSSSRGRIIWSCLGSSGRCRVFSACSCSYSCPCLVAFSSTYFALDDAGIV